ncbi:MAG TPA: hypothetical protein VIV60_28040 [Polyangiaceae bacterium]
MGNACLKEHIRVTCAAIADDYSGFLNQGDNILNNGVMIPDVVGTLALHAKFGGSCLDCTIDFGKLPIKRHHRRHEQGINRFRLA